MREEFAREAEDVLWRRSKLGLRLSKEEAAALQSFMTEKITRRMESVAVEAAYSSGRFA
jgi:glycerol-3-phosphate dehydrogenase